MALPIYRKDVEGNCLILPVAYLGCFVSLLAYGQWRCYPLLCAFLILAMPATLAFKPSDPHILPLIMLALLRLLAGMEVLHRQSAEFYYWGRVMGSTWLLAAMLTGLCWVIRAEPVHDSRLSEVVELRRMSQIWIAMVYIVFETVWLAAGGGWFRKVDLAAAAYGVIAVNHGISSILGISGRWQRVSLWFTAQPFIWGVDAACFSALALIFSRFPIWPKLIAGWRMFRGVRF